MGTMVLQISFFRCLLQRHVFCPASATAATTATITTTTTTTTTTAREGPFSTAPASLSSLADFLVDSLEFSDQQALSTSAKLAKLRQSRGVTKVCAPNFYRNADLVISFLEQKGLEKPQIRKLVSSVPRILTCRIETNLEPKMNYFQELGFSVSDFADIISSQPGILYYGLDSTIRPTVEALRAIMGRLGSNENVVRVMKGFRSNNLLLVTKNLVCNVSLLQALGIPIESIQKRILQCSAPYMRKHEVFKDRVTWVEAKWGISPRSTTFVYALHVLCCRNEKNIESKCRVFESFGFDRSDVVDLFRRGPYCLGMSEGNIKATLRFFMNELGYDIGYIIAHPAVLCYSLTKRVLPRHLVLQLLKDKGLIGENLAFYRALSMTESQFLTRCIRPFEDAVPNLHDIYVNSISSSAQTAD